MSWDCPRGNCRFCGGEIIEDGKRNNRKHWHEPCARFWELLNNPAVMKQYVFVREKGVCQGCGWFRPLMGEFDADHRKPLFEAYGDLRYWEPTNVDLLCKTCHKEKTKEDMILWRKLQETPSTPTK